MFPQPGGAATRTVTVHLKIDLVDNDSGGSRQSQEPAGPGDGERFTGPELGEENRCSKAAEVPEFWTS